MFRVFQVSVPHIPEPDAMSLLSSSLEWKIVILSYLLENLPFDTNLFCATHTHRFIP